MSFVLLYFYLNLFPFPSMGHCVVLEKKSTQYFFNYNVNKVVIQTLKYFFHK